MSEKTCTKCGLLQPLGQYHKDAGAKDGHASRCRACAKIENRNKYLANKAAHNAASEEYYLRNRDKILEYNRRYREQNRDKLAVQKREYYVSNKERLLADMEAYAKEHAVDRAEYQRQYAEQHRDRLRVQARERKQRQPEKVKAKIRQYTQGRYRELRLQFLTALGGACYCCGLNDVRFLTIDHVENDGVHERRPNGKTTNSYTALQRMWARFKSEPHRYQAACYNCNCARQYTEDKTCPHRA